MPATSSRRRPRTSRPKLDVLREHCAAEGRDYDSITKTALAIRPPLPDVDAWLAYVEQLAALGITEVQIMPDRNPVEFATEVAEKVVPRLAGI